ILINNYSNHNHPELPRFPFTTIKLNPPSTSIQNSASPTDHLDISCHMPIHGTHPNRSRTSQRTDHCNRNIPFTMSTLPKTEQPAEAEAQTAI
ncbi:hypothetical protein NPIL_323571, partial [Nephila pilipes]